MNQATMTAVKLLCNVLIETAKEAGAMGAPLGPMYAAFQAKGCSYEFFQRLVNACLATGKVVIRNHCLVHIDTMVDDVVQQYPKTMDYLKS